MTSEQFSAILAVLAKAVEEGRTVKISADEIKVAGEGWEASAPEITVE
jgi:hypothetical protein